MKLRSRLGADFAGDRRMCDEARFDHRIGCASLARLGRGLAPERRGVAPPPAVAAVGLAVVGVLPARRAPGRDARTVQRAALHAPVTGARRRWGQRALVARRNAHEGLGASRGAPLRARLAGRAGPSGRRAEARAEEIARELCAREARGAVELGGAGLAWARPRRSRAGAAVRGATERDVGPASRKGEPRHGERTDLPARGHDLRAQGLAPASTSARKRRAWTLAG